MCYKDVNVMLNYTVYQNFGLIEHWIQQKKVE